MKFFNVIDENCIFLNVGSVSNGKNAAGNYWLAIGNIVGQPGILIYYNFQTEMQVKLVFETIKNSLDGYCEITGYISKKYSRPQTVN